MNRLSPAGSHRVACRRRRRRGRPHRAHGMQPRAQGQYAKGATALHADLRELPHPDRRRTTANIGPQPRLRLQAGARQPGWTRTPSRVSSNSSRAPRGRPRPRRPVSTCPGTPGGRRPQRRRVGTWPASPECRASSRRSSSHSVFFASNCGGCHTLSQAGTTGTNRPEPRPDAAGHERRPRSRSRSAIPTPRSPPVTNRT